MGKINPIQLKKIEERKKRACFLYAQGATFREIAVLLKRSHEWARQAIKEDEKREKKKKLK